MTEGKRVYRSSLRAEQARRTRAAVLDGATRCFLAKGYAATTMKDVATEAGVSVQTVFGQGSKASLLLACVDRAVVGDDEEVPFAQRELFVRLVAETDLAAKLAAVREMARVYVPLTVPMIRVFAEAATVDAEIAAAWTEYERRRFEDDRVLIGSFEPWFREGLDADRATEIFWGIFSHAPAVTLIWERRWTVEEYVDFVVDAVARLLLD
ncbi:TetR/AcrR family transcriptional regulator [Geodermatophilus ruber]|uniref:Transcriptional regulator, TetR family n=1 Tax=Geodermatophilus ruber TaxID=504800 RepID=A0A1I4IKD8_9ACTN|nr:TetR/AcrR family transcriptional regulator [Geodermatophilus ruber]SFL54790.1 transcriptional regulator, TetR family [Geodermatophilus ruber]